MSGSITGVIAALAVGCAGVALAPAPVPRLGRRPVPACAPERTTRRSRDRAVAAHYADAIELVVLAVRAGHLPLAAIRAVHAHMHPAVAEAFAAVIAQVDHGCRFADALHELASRLGPRAHVLADGLAAADRDGQPLTPLLDRLAAEARQERRRRADALARQLPVRLSLPLVLCTLPSFVLLAVAPLLLAALTSLHQ